MVLLTDSQPPYFETRLAILRNKAEREATWVPPEVLEFIADNITDNIRVLEGALIRVGAFANLTSEQLTADTVSHVLSDLVTARQPRPITPQVRSEEHTSELQSLMRISYAVLRLKKKTNKSRKT